MQTPRVESYLLAIWVAAASAACTAYAEKPTTATPAEVKAALPEEFRDLNSPSYERRLRADHLLEQWVATPELAETLAEEFLRAALQPDLPMEARWRIERWRRRLPSVHLDPPPNIAAPELERLVAQLDDDSYAIRLGAGERLQWLAASEHFSAPILALLKRRLSEPVLSQDLFVRIEDVRRIAWGVWLESNSGDRFLPPASAMQIEAWLDELSRPASRRESQAALRSRVARQGLMDAMSQDAEVPRVKAALEARLKGKLDAGAAASLTELLDMTRPVIIAEVWSNRKMQDFEQRMTIGVAKQFEGAQHPSLFDRADEHKAHCASGNALTPQEYDVGVAFPAPHWNAGQEEAVFHIVYLPTPRRQIAYSYYVKTDPAARLAKISRRTLDRFLAEKTLLDDPQLGMLAQLDAREVSRFAGKYFLLVEDGAVEEEIDSEYSTSRKHLGSQSSRFGSICAQLAIDGTRDAMPGLVDAIRQKRFQSPGPLAPYRLEWLAAFSIARRDPWPGVDAWLAENVDNRQTLLIDHNEAAEIGATAAGLLLARHHQRALDLGLQAAPDQHLTEFDVTGYRYSAAEDAQRVRKWWSHEAESDKKTAAK